MSRAVERCANLVLLFAWYRRCHSLEVAGADRLPRDMWRLSGDGQGIPDASFLMQGRIAAERLMGHVVAQKVSF
jgi:hypothetical protein